MLECTVITETTQLIGTRESVPQIDSSKLHERLDKLICKKTSLNSQKSQLEYEVNELVMRRNDQQERVDQKQSTIKYINGGMCQILKETQKWIELWQNEQGRRKIECNSKQATANFIQVDQLSVYIMHLREAIMEKRTRIEGREEGMEESKKLHKESLANLNDDVKVIKKEIKQMKNSLNITK
uniref:Uncharacterized protein n=1 Tax=Rhabditophanes sp. KR3021 TaxID=114890 RepID=A0AC35TI13_9BILA